MSWQLHRCVPVVDDKQLAAGLAEQQYDVAWNLLTGIGKWLGA